MGAQRAIMLSPLTEFMNTTCRAKTGWTCASVDENLDEQMMGMLSYGGKVTLDRVDELVQVWMKLLMKRRWVSYHKVVKLPSTEWMSITCRAKTRWTHASVDENMDEHMIDQLSYGGKVTLAWVDEHTLPSKNWMNVCKCGWEYGWTHDRPVII